MARQPLGVDRDEHGEGVGRRLLLARVRGLVELRKRVTNTVVDFYPLIDTLKRKNGRQVFDKGLDDERFRAGLTGAMASFYMGLSPRTTGGRTTLRVRRFRRGPRRPRGHGGRYRLEGPVRPH